MTVKVYSAAPGASFGDDGAQIIGRYLDTKFGDKPRTAEQVVKAARLKSAPDTFRDQFEWTDSVAAKLHRLEQARLVLRHIRVVYVNGEESPPTRAFHHVVVYADADKKETAYVPARVVWASPDYSSQVVFKALRELRGWANRYREYKELAHIVGGIDDFLEDD